MTHGLRRGRHWRGRHRSGASPAPATIVSTWTGLRPGTPDHLPIIGPVPGRPRLFACTGHYRHGILLAPATGEAVAALLAGRPTSVDLAAFSPERFA